MEWEWAKHSCWLGGGVEGLYELEVEGGMPQSEEEAIPHEFEVDLAITPCRLEQSVDVASIAQQGCHSRDCRYCTSTTNLAVPPTKKPHEVCLM